MSHNIHFNDRTNQYSFFSVKEKPWWGAGTIIEKYPTSKEALCHAGLDFEVAKRPLMTYDSPINDDIEMACNMAKVQVPDHFATIRTDTNTVLGVVGADYSVVQNTHAFAFFDAIVAGGDGIKYETAGVLGKGERIFITAKLPSYIKVGGIDLIENYVFLTSSHDGKGSITAAFTPVRIVCNNTLNAALRNCSNVVRIRHTTNAQEKLKEAHKVMGMVNTLAPIMDNIFNKWASIKITDTELKKLIERAMCPNREVLSKLQLDEYDLTSTHYKNICAKTFEYALSSETQMMETTKGTLFGFYNAVTGYFQNARSYKNQEAKLNSIVYGGIGQQRTQTAFNLCLDISRNGNVADVLN